MDIAALAESLTAFLSPALPYLLKVGEKSIDKIGEKLGAEVFEKACELWKKLSPRVKERTAAMEAAEEVAKAPQHTDAQAGLRLQLEKLLSADLQLAADIAHVLETSEPKVNFKAAVHGGGAIAQGDGSVAAGKSGIAVGGNVYGDFSVKFIKNFSDLDQLKETDKQKLRLRYAELLREKPEEVGLYLALGLYYLDTGLYSEASSYLRIAHEKMPMDPEPLYYLAVSLCRGQRPSDLRNSEITSIESYLQAAIAITPSPKAHYFYLWAQIKHDYYAHHRFKVCPPSVQELINKAEGAEFVVEESLHLLKHVPTPNSPVSTIIEIKIKGDKTQTEQKDTRQRRRYLRREHMLHRYFDKNRSTNYWPSLLITIAGAVLLFYTGQLTKRIDNAVISVLRSDSNFLWYQTHFNTQKMITCFVLLLVGYGSFRLLHMKFPGLFKSVALLSLGIAGITYSSDTAHALSTVAKNLLFSTNNTAFLPEEQVVMYVILFLGIAATAVASPLLIHILRHPVPSDETVQRWLDESIDKLFYHALKKLDIEDAGLVTEEGRRFKLPFALAIDQTNNAGEYGLKRIKIIREFFISIISSMPCLGMFWFPDKNLEELAEIPPECWGERLGRDDVWRSTVYDVLFVFLTHEFMETYLAKYSFIHDTVESENTLRHHYEDVVSVSTNRDAKVTDFELFGNIKCVAVQTFALSFKDNANIEICAPSLIRKPRKFGRQSKPVKAQMTDIDIAVSNIKTKLREIKRPIL